jgi:competence protein ComFB
MEIHNLLEEKVKTSVDEYCESSSFDRKKHCDCIQCRLDVACYVLNNTTPKYVVSSRGIVHHELEYTKKLQLEADILGLVKEGFSVIASRKRPEIDHTKRANHLTGRDFFQFPEHYRKNHQRKNFRAYLKR